MTQKKPTDGGLRKEKMINQTAQHTGGQKKKRGRRNENTLTAHSPTLRELKKRKNEGRHNETIFKWVAQHFGSQKNGGRRYENKIYLQRVAKHAGSQKKKGKPEGVGKKTYVVYTARHTGHILNGDRSPKRMAGAIHRGFIRLHPFPLALLHRSAHKRRFFVVF